MRQRVFRSLVAMLALAYLALLSTAAVGAWSAQFPTAENLQRGLRWDAGNALLWRFTARTALLSLEDHELRRGAAAYHQSLNRNPLDPLAWEGLASIYSRLGDSAAEEAALRGWLVAAPNSPAGAWALGHLLLQQDRSEESFPLLRKAAAGDPDLRPALLELGWKLLADPQAIYEKLVPETLSARAEYLNFLVFDKGLPREAYPIWRQIFSADPQATRRQSETYVEVLAAGGYGRQAEEAWTSILKLTGGTAPAGPERITNGDFELPLRNAGLDWRLYKGPGFQIALDDFQAHSGGRSLRVRFDGTTNPEFASVQQWIIVEPGKRYRLQGYLKTDNITTDNGVFLALTPQGAPASESWELLTANRVGSTPWTREQLDFRTGPATQVLLLQLRRRASGKFNNLLHGTVWLDDFSLQPLPE